MFTIYTMCTFFIYAVILLGLFSLHKKDLYIARLELENNRLKETVIHTKRKANRYELMYNSILDNE